MQNPIIYMLFSKRMTPIIRASGLVTVAEWVAVCHVSACANYELPNIPLTTFLPTLVWYSLFGQLTIQLLDVETKRCQRYQNLLYSMKIAGKNIGRKSGRKSNYAKSSLF